MTVICFALALFAAGAATGTLAARARCVPGSHADHELHELAVVCVVVGLAASTAGIAIAGALP